eukprot:1253828-Pleurochrysis_carterae.AAC.1
MPSHGRLAESPLLWLRASRAATLTPRFARALRVAVLFASHGNSTSCRYSMCHTLTHYTCIAQAV